MKWTLLAITLFFSSLTAQTVDSLADSLLQGPKHNAAMASDKWFAQDKLLHFYFSATIAGLSYHVYTDQMKRDEDRGRIISVSLTALIGLGKELYDKKKKNQFSWKDLAWDGLGLTVGYLLFIQL
jgi:uncharacterized protein YfiM (DUF2279 family)